ncbi:AAA family ATPase [Ensifer adhaerens]|uniref:AAA family ATPase n=1 Tax=Ensifer adhaerens TaxID=106592 RepID=UPI00098FD9FD|nr:adenylate/guanylate cyclase domain-containing protein [Ensifer adhaerens]
MDDVRKWLEGLGLAHFADIFTQSQVDGDSLRMLSEDDLREMEIPVGPRKKIAAAIKLLNADQVAKSFATSAERRQLTILFCDLVDSTGYATRLDPEDFTGLTKAYLAECTAAVRNHNGITANYAGDALQALFGYPIAEEDDAERALELAFDILQLVPRIEVAGVPPLRVRIGIASGLVVVGDFVGAPAGVSTVALGSIPNLAQRLQTIAEPQTIMTDQRTYAAAAGAFEFSDCGSRTLKGFPAEVHVWRADRPKILENRFAKRRELTKLVGRQAEIEGLLALWQEVIERKRGQAAMIVGEPGIGKSRLLFEIQRRILRGTYLTLQCSSTYSNSALFPFLALLKRYAGIDGGDPPEIATAKLETVLALSTVPVSGSLPVFVELLAIDRHVVGHPSARQRDLAHRILIDWLHHLSQIGPVLLSIEDEQWIDPSSSDVLEALVSEAGPFPILILITSRDARRRTATGTDLRTVVLDRLPNEDARTLLHSLVAGHDIGDEITTQLLEKSEGVPLYVEELARAVLESGPCVEERGKNSHPLAVGVPSSIQSSLLSRLDKIGPGKVIAQIAAVVGREFDLSVVAEVCGQPPDIVETTLRRLVEAGLVMRQTSAGEPRYAFTHALLQEAARESLLKERRRELHAQVARTIDSINPKLAEEHPEVLAQHLAEAALFEEAAGRWLAAGRNTGRTWTKVEAANMFANGLACLARCPPSVERDRMELALELERGDVLYATFGYVTGEGSAAYRNVIRLSEKLGDAAAPIRALDGLFGTALNSGRFADAEWAGDELLAIGKTHDNLKAFVLGLQFKGMCFFSQGHFEQARDCLEQALLHVDRADEIGSDFPSMAMLYLSWTLQVTGHEESAIELYAAAEADARHRSSYQLAACLGNCCILYALRGEFRPLQYKLDELYTLAKANGFRMWTNVASFFQGWIMARGNDSLGIVGMEQTRANLGEQEIDKSCYLGLLGESYLQAGDVKRAADTLDEALALVEHTGENYFTAELLRLRGEVEFRCGRTNEAERYIRSAIAFACRQGATLWERKALQSLKALMDG